MRTSTPTSIALSASLVAGLIPFGAAAQEPLGSEPVRTLTERLTAAIASDAQALGGDPTTSREYVAARIGYEAYDGVLKGAAGAYLTGTANGADQALLLEALLHPAVETRFAQCTPDEALVRELAAEDAETDAGRGLALDHIEQIQAQIDDPELSDAVAEVLDLRSTVKLDAARAADRLSDDLYDTGYTPVEAPAAAVTAHVWLQAFVDGEWLDLDTTTVDGTARCAPESTADSLDEAFEHVIRFVVGAEERNGGALETVELLATSFPTADLAASRVSLLFGEPAGLLEEADPASTTAAYTPLLRVDGASFVAEAAIELPRPAPDLAASVDDTLGGVTGLFDSLPGGIEEVEDEEEADEADGGGGLFGGGDDGGLFGEIGLPGADDGPETTAMWLEVELLAPNGETVSTRTQLFDRIGMDARATGDVVSTDLAPLDEVGGEYAPMSTLWQIGFLVGEPSAVEAAVVEPLDPSSVDSYAAQLDAQLRTFPAIFRDMGGDGLTPALLVASLGPALDSAGAPVTSLAVDALHVPSRPPADDRAAALDAHALLAAERMLTALSGSDSASAADSAAVLEQARNDGTELVLLAPGDTTDTLTASPEALVRIQSRLDAGFSLLVPETQASIDGVEASAWWTLDPASGVVRDEHESGRHTDTTEYAVKTEQTLTTMERFRRFGCRIAGPARTAALVLFLATTASPISPLFEPLSEVVEAARVAREAESARKAAEDAACALG